MQLSCGILILSLVGFSPSVPHRAPKLPHIVAFNNGVLVNLSKTPTVVVIYHSF